MGGGAFGERLPRLNHEEYYQLSEEVCVVLRDFYKIVVLPRVLPTKESFGDIDILVFHQNKKFSPESDLSSRKQVRNNNVLSFEYNGFQIDVIEKDEKEFELVKFHYDYGDIAALVGIIVRKIGLKLSIKGLYVICDSSKIFLTHVVEDIFKFLGLNYSVWKEGFVDEQQIFDFIISSKYFRRDYFIEQNRRYKHDLSTRPLIKNFYEYIKLKSSEENIKRIDLSDEALIFFKKINVRDMLKIEKNKKSIIYDKFNGNLVMEWTGLKGSELGIMMKKLNDKLSQDELLKLESSEIKHFVISLYEGGTCNCDF